MSMVLVKGNATRFVSMLAQRGALHLEVLGMARSGRSVYAIVKQQYKLKGNKQRVLQQLEDLIEQEQGFNLSHRYTPRKEKK